MLRFIFQAVGRLIWGAIAWAGRVMWAFVRPGLKVASVVLVLAAVVALTSDVTRWQTGERGPMFQSLEATIRATAPSTLETVGALVSERVHPLAWDPVLLGLMRLPAWMVLVGLALGFGIAARERRGVDIFVN